MPAGEAVVMLRCIIMNKSKVLTVGPDIKGLGGISSVLRSYRSFVPGFTYLPTNSRKGMLAGAVALASTLVRLPFYRFCGYGIVHAQGASGKSFVRKRLVLSWARLWGFRTIYHCHGGGFRDFVKRSDRKSIVDFLKSCSAVCVLTEGWRRYFAGELGCANVHVLNNPIIPPVEKVSRTDGTRNGMLNFLFIGKICPEKGVLDIVAAVASKFDYFRSRCRVIIAGNGDTIDLQAEIHKAQVGEVVKFAGPLYGDDKDRALRECDVMLLPSYTEGMPITLLEAGAYGMPSIASGVGGIPEMITDGVNGTLIDAGDIDALANAMSYYIDLRDEMYRQGREAEEAVKAYYPDAIIKSLKTIYTSF